MPSIPIHTPRATLATAADVTPLELFFDLVFVLALTQCTALMAHEPTWEGLVQGLLVLGVLWWAWVGYAWLTSVVDPEEGAVRIAMFAAMAALLVVALCVPEAFGDRRAPVRRAPTASSASPHIALFVIASRDDPALRRSVVGLAVEHRDRRRPARRRRRSPTAALQGALWALALAARHGRARSCSASRAGSSCPATSPSATG